MSGMESLFRNLRHVLLHVVPLTISGYLVVVLLFAVGFRGLATVEYLANIAETGLMVSAVGCCYYLGWAFFVLTSKLFSIVTHEKRMEVE